MGTTLTATNSPLTSGQSITSPNGDYALTMQPTGNLVASSGHWQSGAAGAGGYASILASGDLVIYNAANAGVFHSNIPRAGAYLAINNSGDVQLIASSGSVISTNPTMHAL